MLRPTKLKLVFGMLLVAATYFVCINSHVDIFPCEVRRLSAATRTLGSPEADSCSLMQTQGDYFQPPEGAELTPAGYAVAVLVVGVVPLVVGFMLGSVLRRRRD